MPRRWPPAPRKRASPVVHPLHSVGHPWEGVASESEKVERVQGGSFYDHSVPATLHSKHVQCSSSLELEGSVPTGHSMSDSKVGPHAGSLRQVP